MSLFGVEKKRVKAVNGMKSESRQVEDEDEDERIFACSIIWRLVACRAVA